MFPLLGHYFIAATKQLNERYFLSFCPSVCLSVCHTFLTMFQSSYHHEIFRSYYQWQKWLPCKRSRSEPKVKVTEVNIQLSRFRTVTPVWIHIWWWNYAQSFMLLRRGTLSFFKVIRQIWRSHDSKNRRIWPKLGVSRLTGDPLHSRAPAHSLAPLFTKPCPHCSHSRAPGEQWARLCVFTLQGCVQAAWLCRGSSVGL